ncbi:MAG: efflux transporter outer membrane subunit [Cellvibrionaceae bacterium]|nr:efflux transporter outer membrane subunit [Cellvibrionaceae bacterium]
MRKSLNCALIALFVLFGSACSSIPEHHSQKDVLADIELPSDWLVEYEGEIRKDLLQLFSSPGLNAVVEKAIKNNLNIRLASKQILAAGIRANIGDSNLWPSINLNAHGSRSSEGRSKTINNFNSAFDVTWEMDLWGRYAAESKALGADVAEKIYSLERMRDSIAAQTMQSWFNLLTTRLLVKADEKRLRSLKSTEQSIRNRFIAGLGSLNDLDAARRNAAQAEAILIERKQQFNNTARQLDLILGQYPGESAYDATELDLPKLLPPPPPGVPADTLAARPDLNAAWYRVVAADARADSSHRARFPAIKITGQTGKASKEFTKFLDSPTSWSLGASITAPIFNYGRLKRQSLLSQNHAQQAYINYVKACLSAFNEVERALGLEGNLREREYALESAFTYALRTYKNAQQDYISGGIPVLDLLHSQRALFDAEVALINIRNLRLQNRVTLSLALGKGL